MKTHHLVALSASCSRFLCAWVCQVHRPMETVVFPDTSSSLTTTIPTMYGTGPRTPKPNKHVQAIVSSHASNPPPRRVESAGPVKMAEVRRAFVKAWATLVVADAEPTEDEQGVSVCVYVCMCVCVCVCFNCSCDFSETSAIRECMKVLFSVVCDSDQFTESGCLRHQAPALAYPYVLLILKKPCLATANATPNKSACRFFPYT
jgi:hypothetical protein